MTAVLGALAIAPGLPALGATFYYKGELDSYRQLKNQLPANTPERAAVQKHINYSGYQLSLSILAAATCIAAGGALMCALHYAEHPSLAQVTQRTMQAAKWCGVAAAGPVGLGLMTGALWSQIKPPLPPAPAAGAN
jgi:hypothetical protein